MVRECFFFFVARGLSPAMLSRIYKIKQDFLDLQDSQDFPDERALVNANFLFTVARGPVPRERSTQTKNVRSPETTDVCCEDRRTARDRPSPYGAQRDVLCTTVARGPVPRFCSLQSPDRKQG
ncbi:hypothetical protein C6495_11495 [Candidatus Poribacteria bacterium]|nr:MAG: hypothetical protein C6495_11495 [Candidatus Poribacteria bacterium]